jgi:spermidine/putrescine transport system ATP-binding protein
VELVGVLPVGTPDGRFLVPLGGRAAPAPGAEVSFSIRAELVQEGAALDNAISARCTTVEFFGAYRRHVLESGSGVVLKYDQFGAARPRLRAGETTTLAWRTEDAVLHA